VAAENVSVHKSDSVAQKVVQKMIGQPAFTFSFSRKDKAETLGETSAVKVAPHRTIDSAFLFLATLWTRAGHYIFALWFLLLLSSSFIYLFFLA